MKSLILVVVLMMSVLRSLAGFAPGSIAGLVYRDTLISARTRTSAEKTILFQSGTRFIYLKDGSGSALNLAFVFGIKLNAPRPDGAYVYTRTGENSAVVTLNFDGGGSETLNLDFTTAEGGASDSGTGPNVSFSLWPIVAQEHLAATNISTRARVEPGRPMIVGFVVPGVSIQSYPPPATNTFTPPAGLKQREVVIRAVGPSLAQFSVSGAWADPDFQLVTPEGSISGNNNVHYKNWAVLPTTPGQPEGAVDAGSEAGFRKLFNYVGAFPLPTGSKDAVQVARLNPGAYTVIASALPGDAGGEVLIEVYFLP